MLVLVCKLEQEIILVETIRVTVRQRCARHPHAGRKPARRSHRPAVLESVRRWIQRTDMRTLFIPKGSPCKNGYVESSGGKLRDELLNVELFLSLEEFRWMIDRWRLDYNHHRMPSALDYQTPAAYEAGNIFSASAVDQPPEHSRLTLP